MDNLITPSNVSADELPAGFTTADPNHPSSGGGNNSNGAEEEFKKQAVQERRQIILEQAMDSDALARLGRIRMVRPDKAAAVENTIVAMTMQGKLPGRISEAKLIEILERGHHQGKVGSSSASQAAAAATSISIQRKRYAFDSDDDEGDDDDDI
jgi:programmed cell death protein 5